MTIAELQALYAQVFAEWVRELELEVRAASGDGVTLALPVRARHVHAGGVVCGQTLMAAADTALVLAISHKLGGFRPQTTVQLQTSFLRAGPVVSRRSTSTTWPFRRPRASITPGA